MSNQVPPEPPPQSGWFEPAGAGPARYCLLATALGVVLPAAAALGVVVWARVDGHRPTSWSGDLRILLLAVVASVVVATAAQWAWRWTALPDAGLADFLPHRWMRQRRAQRKAHRQLRTLDALHGPSPKATKLLAKLSRTLTAADVYERGRPKRRARLAYDVARQLGLPEAQARQAELAARLQDLGQAAIPATTLHQRGPLSSLEGDRVRQHPITSAELIAPYVDAEVTGAVRAHHERVDGTGYPEGLTSTELPVIATVLAVVDTYEALVHTRPYRHRCSPAYAAAELRNVAGRWLAEEPVEALIAVEGLHSGLAGTAWGWVSAPARRLQRTFRDSATALTAAVAVALVALAGWAGVLTAGGATVAMVSPSPKPNRTPDSVQSPPPATAPVQVAAPSVSASALSPAAPPVNAPASSPARRQSTQKASTAHSVAPSSGTSSPPMKAVVTGPAPSIIAVPAAPANPAPSPAPSPASPQPRPRRSRLPVPSPSPSGPAPSPSTSPAGARPSLTGLNPASGSTAGGTTVTISGSGLSGATAVEFGSAAASFQVDDADTITATSPPAGVGLVVVRVVTPAGTSTPSLASFFQYRS
ncbi:MAG: HD domain-containing phosphohydrolase [Actinomycetota bacterium]